MGADVYTLSILRCAHKNTLLPYHDQTWLGQQDVFSLLGYEVNKTIDMTKSFSLYAAVWGRLC